MRPGDRRISWQDGKPYPATGDRPRARGAAVIEAGEGAPRAGRKGEAADSLSSDGMRKLCHAGTLGLVCLQAMVLDGIPKVSTGDKRRSCSSYGAQSTLSLRAKTHLQANGVARVAHKLA